MEPILPEPYPVESISQNPENTQVQPAPASNPENNPNVSGEVNPEIMPQALAKQPAQQIQAVQDPQTTAATPDPAQSTDASTDQSGNPLIADDVDVIEKEWVDRAKEVVNKTKEDPRQQEKEVSKLQADYLAKRYNKNIKQAD